MRPWEIVGAVAVLVMSACTSSSSSDPRIDVPSAHTVSTDPSTTAPPAPFETYVVGDTLYIRSGCRAADPILRGGADGLPKEGQTEQARVASLVDDDRVSLLAEFNAVDVRMVPRNGQVWTGPGNGDYEIVDAHDFQIEIILGDEATCPTAPYFWNGVPVLFTACSDPCS